tara:strand:+ start:165 stop:791 length:627 start_codon:yes stop_codon:yes gene_type:complete
MKISYAVTVCDEFEEIKTLLTLLLNSKRDKDEIVVLVDLTKTTPTSELLGYLHKLSSNDHITLVEDIFNNHFAKWKNRLSRACKGDYIFQIDADEYPHGHLLKALPSILEANPVDLIRVPRVNTVKGLTAYHIETWGWNVNKDNWINWPDMQWRIYKNNKNIQWVGNVHEKISGHETFAELPAEEAYALYHPKDIKRQEKQNKYYNTL